MSYGKIGTIAMSLPIKSFLLGIYSPVEIRIEKIEIFLKTSSDWEFFDYTSFDYKSQLLRSLTDNLIFKLKLKQNPDMNNTYLNRTISYLVDNIIMDVKDITIIFEDIYSHKTKNIFCGAKIEKISISNNVDKFGNFTKNNQNLGGIKKNFSIINFSFFLIPTSSKNKKISFDYYSSLSNYGHNFIRDHSSLFTDASASSSYEINLKNFYIIHPTSINISIVHSNTYYLSILVDDIDFHITSPQLESIIALIRFIDNYKIYFRNCYSLRKLKFYKPKEKNLTFLKHYFSGVIKLIKEKKYNIEMFSLAQSMDKYEKIFREQYKLYYYNTSSMPSEELKEVICYVDTNILTKWIKEELGNIISYINSMQSGFFYGIFSYFYTSAISNFSEINKGENETKINFETEVVVNMNFFTFSISRGKNDNDLQHKNEIIKFTFKKNYFELKMLNYFENFDGKAYIQNLKIEYIYIINKSNFKSEIFFVEKANGFTQNSKSMETILSTKLIKTNMISHCFVYNQNMINFLFSFFTLDDIDIFAKKMFSLSKEETKEGEKKEEKPNNIGISVEVKNHKIIFPFKSSNEKLTLNSGDLLFTSSQDCTFNITLTNINLHFLQAIIIENFILSLKITPKLLSINCTEIFCNLSQSSIEKLLTSYQEIFTLRNYKELWMMKIKQKDIIFNNSIMRGLLLYKSQQSEKLDKYYSLISGGYIYLFSNSSNEEASILIPLNQSKITSIEKHNDIYTFSILCEDGRKFTIGFINEKILNEWKTAIEKRINDINISSYNDSSNYYNSRNERKNKIKKLVNNKTVPTLKQCASVIKSISKYLKNNELGEPKVVGGIKGIEMLIQNEDVSKNNKISMKLKDIKCSYSEGEDICFVNVDLDGLNIISNGNIHLVHFDTNDTLISCCCVIYSSKAYSIVKTEMYKDIIPLICEDKIIAQYIKDEMTQISIKFEIKANVLLMYEPGAAAYIAEVSRDVAKIAANSTTNVVKAVEGSIKNEEIANDQVTMRIMVNTNNIGISLLNKKTYMCLFKLIVENVSVDHFSHKKSKVTTGSISLLSTQQIMFKLDNNRKGMNLLYEVNNNISNLDVNILGNIGINLYYSLYMKLITYIEEDIIDIFHTKKQKKSLNNIIETPENGLFVINSTALTKGIFIRLLDKDNENIWYELKVDSVSLTNSKDIQLNNVLFTSYDSYHLFRAEVQMNSDLVTTNVDLGKVDVQIRKEDVDNISNILDNLLDNINNHFLQENKGNKNVKEVFLSNVNFHSPEVNCKLEISKNKYLNIHLNDIDCSLTNYTTKTVSIFQVQEISIKLNLLIFFSSQNKNKYKKIIYVNISNDYLTNTNEIYVNISSFSINMINELFDITNLFSIKPKKRSINLNGEGPNLLSQSKKTKKTNVTIFLDNPLFYIKIPESTASIITQFKLSLSLSTIIGVSTITSFQIQTFNFTIFTSEISSQNGILNFSKSKDILLPTAMLIEGKIKSLFPNTSVSIYSSFHPLKFSFSIEDISLFTFLSSFLLSKRQGDQSEETFFPLEESIYISKKDSFEIFVKFPLLSLSLMRLRSSFFLLSIPQTEFTLSKNKIKASTGLSVSYLNMKNDRLEPFLENIIINLGLSLDNNYNISKCLLDLPEDFNINVTEEGLYTINEVYEYLTGKKNKNEFLCGNLLCNYSGYEIEVNDGNFFLKNGSSIDIENNNIYNFTIKNLDQTFLINPETNVYEIGSNKIVYFEEISQVKKKIIFYSKFLLQSFCDKTLVINSINNVNNSLHMNEMLGLNQNKISITNYQTNVTNELNLDLVKNASTIQLEDLKINVDKIQIKNETVFKFNIYPNIIIHNCIDIPLTFHLCESNEDVAIKKNQKTHLYFDKMLFCQNFYLKFKHKHFNFVSEKIKLTVDFFNGKENSIKVSFTNEIFKIKLNYIDVKGVLYLYLFFDYIVINNTNFDIYPANSKIDLQYKSEKLKYYPINNFKNINLILNEGNDNIISLPNISIDKKNYAFFKQVSILINKDTNTYVTLLIQRHLRYYKFTKIKKIDMLLISRKNEEDDNQSLFSISSENEKKIKAMTICQYSLRISNINISIIATNEYRKELALINIYNTRVGFKKDIRENGEIINTIESRVESVQIENMDENAVYKVVLFTNQLDEDEEKEVIRVNENTRCTRNFIYCTISYKRGGDQYYKYTVEKIIFVIRSFSIFLDSEFAADISHFIFKSQKSLSGGSFYCENVSQAIESLSSISRTLRGKKSKPIFISSINTSPISILFSYKNISNRLFDELNLRSTIVQNIIDLFATTTHITLSLNSLEMTKVSGDMKEILEKIRDYHYYNIIRQCIKLLFSIDILGNPLGLIERLGKGVKDFIYFPLAGAAGGPSKFVVGSFSGAKSLLSHAVGGVFDSAHKITAGIGKSILKLTDSDEYISDKNVILKQYDDNKSGQYATAMKLMLVGIKFGMRDLVWFPYWYYSNKGVMYLPKGSMLGLTSIIVKPVSGVLDFVSFFSNQMAKSVLVDYDAKFKYIRINHVRNKRLFWEEEKKISK